MPSQRHIGRSRLPAGRPDIGLWHLSAALVLVGGALAETIGPPALPWTVLVSLGRLAQSGLRAPSELVRLVAQGITGSAPDSTAVSSIPTVIDLELFFRSPSTTQLDAIAIMLTWIAWLLWLWLLGTTILRIVVVLGERAAAGALWSDRLRAVSDRITLSLVRQAVDTTLASEMFLRAVAPSPAPVVPPRIDHAQVQFSEVANARSSPYVAAVQEGAMATDLQPGDVLYTVQPGDNLSAIAERFYGDPAAFSQILEANLGRAQPRGQTLRDARFLYPGWQLVVPDPTQTVYTDPDRRRWYTVRAGDTLSGISARLLGDAQRYPEVFARQPGCRTGRWPRPHKPEPDLARITPAPAVRATVRGRCRASVC